jgi:hypothetical protein
MVDENGSLTGKEVTFRQLLLTRWEVKAYRHGDTDSDVFCPDPQHFACSDACLPLQNFKKLTFKGTVLRDFRSLFFLLNQPHMGH